MEGIKKFQPPVPSKKYIANTNVLEYVVKLGDTLSSIAKRIGTVLRLPTKPTPSLELVVSEYVELLDGLLLWSINLLYYSCNLSTANDRYVFSMCIDSIRNRFDYRNLEKI